MIISNIENNHDVCRRKDCMKKFCESFRQEIMKIIYFKKKKNAVINNQTTEIIRKYKNLLYMNKS